MLEDEKYGIQGITDMQGFEREREGGREGRRGEGRGREGERERQVKESTGML